MNNRKMLREEVERLYAQLGPGLVTYACSIVGDRASAEDVLHQVFLKLLERSVLAPDDPRTYLYRAVRNAALNAQRSRSRHVELDSQPAWFEASSGSTGEGLALELALKELPGEQREVIMLRIWGGMTLEESAAVLDIPANTAASRYRYGLAKLRHRLERV